MSYRTHYDAFGNPDGVDGDTGGGDVVDLSAVVNQLSGINNTIKREKHLDRTFLREQFAVTNQNLSFIGKELKERNKIERIRLREEVKTKVRNILRTMNFNSLEEFEKASLILIKHYNETYRVK